MAPVNPNTADTLFEGKFLRVKKNGPWEYVERCKASGGVAVLAVTENQELVLVEQFRIPLYQRVIEIPAGLAGDMEGEAQAEAAKRELLEETGFEARHMEFLTQGPSSAGLATEVVSFFRARGLNRVAEGGGDASEEIQVHLVPLQELHSWIDAKLAEGCMVDFKVYAALYFHSMPSRGTIE